jgi:hypothetical protein
LKVFFGVKREGLAKRRSGACDYFGANGRDRRGASDEVDAEGAEIAEGFPNVLRVSGNGLDPTTGSNVSSWHAQVSREEWCRMSQSQETGPVVKPETAPPTEEHRKASREGRVILAGALVLMLIAVVAALAGSGTVAMTSAGLCVALLVVGLLLRFEGERQKQRPGRREPGKSLR